MRNSITLMSAVAALAFAGPALAAPTIISASVTGPTGTIWDTASNSYYTLFMSPLAGAIMNPKDNFSSYAMKNPVNDDYAFAIYGDGFPTNALVVGKKSYFPNSDLIYKLTVKLQEGSQTGTLTGNFIPLLGAYGFDATGKAFVSSSGTYTLADFGWNRTGSNLVGAFSSTNTAFDAKLSPGSGRDYMGRFTINQVAAVPEPATWAMMIMGFGVIGAGLRGRRSQAARVTYA